MPRHHHRLVWRKQKGYVLRRMDKSEAERDRETRFSITKSCPKQPVIKLP